VKRLRKFPIADPSIAQLAGADGEAKNIMYSHFRNFLDGMKLAQWDEYRTMLAETTVTSEEPELVAAATVKVSKQKQLEAA
jgi:hypothetical protein